MLAYLKHIKTHEKKGIENMFKLKRYLRDVQCWQRYENFMQLTVFLIRTVTVKGAP